MGILLSEIGAIKVVRLPVELDGTAAEETQALFTSLIQAGHVKILCDLSATERVSPAGLNVFLAAFKEVHERQGQMAFCRLQPAVREVFVAAGLTHIYKYYDFGEALQVSILKELSSEFDEYADVHEIRLQRQEDCLRIDLFLEFDGNKRMAAVQQSINKIKRNLEEKIKGSEVCVIPTSAAV